VIAAVYLLIYLSVCWFVSRIAQKVTGGFAEIFMEVTLGPI